MRNGDMRRMKIGIYLIDAVVTGTTKFVFELADGLREAGQDVTTLTSTKSGREPLRWTKPDGGARWWFESPDRTVKHDDLPETFNDFDLIIVNDVGSSTLDSEDHRFNMPGYVYGLMQTTTPWISVAHGNSYDQKHAPHFPAMLGDAKRPPRAVIATSAPYSYADHDLFKSLTPIYMRRPYRSRYQVYDEASQGNAASSMGRFSTGKNLHALALTLPFAEPGTTRLTVDGASISSARPTVAYLTYEVLEALDDVTSVWPPESKNRTSAWSLRNRQGTMLEYRGAYTDPLTFLHQDTKVFVNSTAPAFSAGTEYTTMEAVDAGCLLLTTANMVDSGSALAYGVLEPWDIPNSPKTTLSRCANELQTLASRVDRALQTDAESHEKIAHFNRNVLWTEHHPSVVAKQLMADLAGTDY